MMPHYHREVTTQAVGHLFGADELAEVLSGNLRQDLPGGQVGHPEYHFDDSAFARTYAYLEDLKGSVTRSLSIGDGFTPARRDFGRFTHAVQDFYSHSNYITLWCRKQGVTPENWDGAVECLDAEIIHHPKLISGHFHSPWEAITFLPRIGRSFARLFPADSHANMNMDGPEHPYFPISYQAALQRTRHDTLELLQPFLASHPRNLQAFLGKAVTRLEGV